MTGDFFFLGEFTEGKAKTKDLTKLWTEHPLNPAKVVQEN